MELAALVYINSIVFYVCNMPVKTVLVMFKKNTRAVTFSHTLCKRFCTVNNNNNNNSPPTNADSACTEVDVVMDAIRRTFSDVLKPGQEFFLKTKSKDPDWDEVFVDVQVKDSLADKSVVRAELKESDTDDTSKVGVWHEC